MKYHKCTIKVEDYDITRFRGFLVFDENGNPLASMKNIIDAKALIDTPKSERDLFIVTH